MIILVYDYDVALRCRLDRVPMYVVGHVINNVLNNDEFRNSIRNSPRDFLLRDNAR